MDCRFVRRLRPHWLPTLALLLSAMVGCRDSRPRTLDGQGSTPPGTLPPVGAAPCESGATRGCSVTVGEHNGVLTCYRGSQLCVEGRWSACSGGTLSAMSGTGQERSPARGRTPSVSSLMQSIGKRALGLAAPQGCAENPCDPLCARFESAPEGGLWGDAGRAPGESPFDWEGGSFFNVPPAAISAGLQPRCTSSGDCQFNHVCKNPSPASCDHSVCETGGGLQGGCTDCTADVCVAQPQCCSSFVSTCAHSTCVEGPPLTSSCEPCAAAICNADPSCCSDYWTSDCVALTDSLCGSPCGCGSGEVAGPNGTCLHRRDTRSSWTSARTACQARGQGWDLATLTSSTENSAAYSLGLSRDHWIGGEKPSSQWSWVTGESMSYTNWDSSEPDWDRCMALRDENARWRDSSCGSNRPAICEGPPGASSPCGEGGVQGPDGTCYFYESSSRPWTSAQSACRNRGDGWDLATIESSAENAFLYDTFPLHSDTWIGLNDRSSEGTFVWSSGSPLSYTNWRSGDPDGDDCAAMRDENGQWRARWCSENRPSLCSAPSATGPSAWDASCVALAQSQCGISCDADYAPVGECVPWYPGETDASCPGIDLGVGLPCGGVVPICNHGTVAAPAGLKLVHLPADHGGLGSCAPDLSGPDVATCTTTEAIDPGACINLTGCGGLADGRLLMVNPSDGSQVSECHCNNNWSIYDASECGPPACSGNASQSDLRQVNMFIAYDSSGSMEWDGRWAASTSALNSFFVDPASAGIGVALQFFPYDCASDDCDASACAVPQVPLGVLTTETGSADPQEQALVDKVNSIYPVGGTPTYPALAGAQQWALSGMQSDPNALWVVVLVTDGEPSWCETDRTAIANLAAAGLPDGVLTYAIGLAGSNETFLNDIAAAGGTNQAFMIESGSPAVVAQELGDALRSIAGTSVSCDLELPNQGSFAPDRATVSYYPGDGSERVELEQVSTAGACGEGWFYDEPDAPTRMTLCPTTCSALQQDTLARLEVYIGCPDPVTEPITTRKREQYEAQCESGKLPQWGYLSFDSVIPGDAQIVFSARSADTAAGLASESFVPLTTATAEAPSCALYGPAPCPVDLYELLGGDPAVHRRFLELEFALTTSSIGEAPSVRSWQVNFTCLDNQ